MNLGSKTKLINHRDPRYLRSLHTFPGPRVIPARVHHTPLLLLQSATIYGGAKTNLHFRTQILYTSPPNFCNEFRRRFRSYGKADTCRAHRQSMELSLETGDRRRWYPCGTCFVQRRQDRTNLGTKPCYRIFSVQGSLSLSLNFQLGFRF